MLSFRMNDSSFKAAGQEKQKQTLRLPRPTMIQHAQSDACHFYALPRVNIIILVKDNFDRRISTLCAESNGVRSYSTKKSPAAGSLLKVGDNRLPHSVMGKKLWNAIRCYAKASVCCINSCCTNDQIIWNDRGALVCSCRIKVASMEGSHDDNNYNCLLHNRWVFRWNYEKSQLMMLDKFAIGVAPGDVRTFLRYWNLFYDGFGSLIHHHAPAEGPHQSTSALPPDKAQCKDVDQYAEMEPLDMFAAQSLCELKDQSKLHEKHHEIDNFSPKSGKLAHDYSPQNTAPRRIVFKMKNLTRSGGRDEKNQVSSYRKRASIFGIRNKVLPASIELIDRWHMHSPGCEQDTEKPDFPSKLTDGGMKSSLIKGSIGRPMIEKSMNPTRNYLKKRKRDIPSSATSPGASNVSVNSSKRPRKYKTLAELYN